MVISVTMSVNPMSVISRKVIVVTTAVLIVAAYFRVLRSMLRLWLTDDDMSHGILVLPVIAWILYIERERFRTLPAKPSAWGWLVLAGGAALQLASARGAGIFIGSAAMITTAAGAVLCLGGIAWMRALAFPFVLSAFMLPKLAYFYNELTLPLQLFATRMAAGMLTMAGLGVVRAGNLLTVAGNQVLVEEACNGLRYVFPLAFISVVFAHLSRSKFWIQAALMAAALPVAMLANALRVALAAASPRLTVGTWHTAAGVAVFVLTMSVIIAIHRFFRSIDRRIRA